MSFIIGLAILPSAVAPALRKNPAFLASALEWLAYTPPFAAAAAMIHPGAPALRALALLVWWSLGLAAALVWLENRPPRRRAAESVKVAWDGPTDRIGAFFGPDLGPLVAHWLRFYVRNNRTRVMSLISIPLLAFLTTRSAQKLGPYSMFSAALGTIAIVPFMGVSRLALNQFGYSGGAFRRYFLLPVASTETLRAASYASVTFGAATLSVALLVWLALAPFARDARMVFMLACSGVTGLFAFNACGIWVHSVQSAQRELLHGNFGNDLSLGGNNALLRGVILAMLVPRELYAFNPTAVSPEAWRMVVLLPVAAASVYFATLKAAGPIFMARREKLLAVVEGRA